MGYRYDGEKRRTKIIIPILLILLCLIAIVGSTYALFTDSGNDGKIGINVTSGECKVDIVDTEESSLVGDVLRFVTPDNRENVYFEPGSTYYTEGFSVQNIGTVPVNFRMYISADKNEDMDEFEKAFDLWITKDPKNLESAEKLTSFSGRLEFGQQSETYYLVVKMKESAGNAFQDKKYTGIGVTVYAVQGNVEMG